MVTFRKMKIQEIVEDVSISTDEKIAKLREIESEAEDCNAPPRKVLWLMTTVGRMNFAKCASLSTSSAQKNQRRAQQHSRRILKLVVKI
ncbi:hypothetical protein [Mesorhizobium sp. M00.F.Ca.ET.216.01.1.1]|uniref:hypothetical protein n=1 Tax=Mesorhizobium sp. M00.F.Ca.ET.216.01.1.1 TaxID=2500528 RepID=UPI001FE017F5|nr:hypothetical protein [Mesorhizobium sp. M00.F.Ca.ET.216.01.1.1]